MNASDWSGDWAGGWAEWLTADAVSLLSQLSHFGLLMFHHPAGQHLSVQPPLNFNCAAIMAIDNREHNSTSAISPCRSV